MATPQFYQQTSYSRLAEVHFYKSETNRDYPPVDMTILGQIVGALRTTSCDWWTIELGSVTKIEATCRLLREYLKNGKCPNKGL